MPEMWAFASNVSDVVVNGAEPADFVAIESIVAMMLVATAVGMIAHRIRIPFTVALVLVGLALRWLNITPEFELTRDLLLMVFLPALLFEAAIHFPANELRQYAGAISMLAAPGVILTAFGTAFVLDMEFQVFQVESPATFIHFLLFGTIIAATDPISVITLLRQLGVSKKLSLLMEGESLFNDGTAIVLFTVVLGALQSGSFSLSEGILNFITVAIGGILVGAVLGLFASLLISFTEDHLIAIALTMVTAYGSYLIAEKFHASGILATVVAGLFVGNIGKERGMTPNNRIAVVSFWQYLAFFIGSIIFLLIGLEVNIVFILTNWEVVIFAFLAVVLARAISVYFPLPLVNRFSGKIDIKEATVIWWGGLRGALSMVLVLSLPESLEARDTLIAMTFGVVLLSVVFQGTTMGWLLRKLHMLSSRTDATAFLARNMARLKAINQQQEAIKQLVAKDIPGVDDISVRLHAERAMIIKSLEERKNEPEFVEASQNRIAALEKYLEEVARDSYRESRQTSLLTDEEASELTAGLQRLNQ